MNRSIQRTHDSPLNNSKSKQTYAFPRAARFSNDSFMSYAFGIDRSRQTSYSPSFSAIRNTTPSPGQYKMPSFTQQAIRKGKGPSIHQAQRYPKSQSTIQRQPGPGSYSPKLRKNTPSISISGATPRLFEKRPEEQYLSPTTYHAQRYSTIQDKRTSKFKNNSTIIFPKAPRFTRDPRQIQKKPGPGQYQSFSEFAERRSTINEKLNKMTQLLRL